MFDPELQVPLQALVLRLLLPAGVVSMPVVLLVHSMQEVLQGVAQSHDIQEGQLLRKY